MKVLFIAQASAKQLPPISVLLGQYLLFGSDPRKSMAMILELLIRQPAEVRLPMHNWLILSSVTGMDHIYGPALEGFNFPLFPWGFHQTLDAINTTVISEHKRNHTVTALQTVPSAFADGEDILLGSGYSMRVIDANGNPTDLFVDASEVETAFRTLDLHFKKMDAAVYGMFKALRHTFHPYPQQGNQKKRGGATFGAPAGTQPQQPQMTQQAQQAYYPQQQQQYQGSGVDRKNHKGGPAEV